MKRSLGTCYYPEHWPEDIWARDAERMVEAGLSWVRIGEFGWSRLEPRPGELDWRWLDTAVEVLGQAGLKIIMGTPTATPPRWMLDKWPDMLARDAQGQERKFGSRRHYCFSHVGYRHESARITELMALRYGGHPAVVAWQTDNEYGCHDTTLSYSAAAQAGFRAWLADRYGSIEALNRAWGNVFWSMDYERFDQIDLPNLTVTEANPVHWLDFQRFSSDQVVAFNRIQAEILRRHTEVPLIHNYMGRITDFDHYQVGADLDIASWDSYPLGFLEDRSDDGDGWKLRFSRQGDPDFQAFHHDLYRSVGKGRWWVMEQQPGPVNWAPYNPAPLPGMVRLWSWEAFAHGAEMVCYFRWRQAPFAQEQMHAGLLRPDSVDAPGLEEARVVASEIDMLPDVGTACAPVALVFDYESAWSWKIQPQGASFDYFRLVFEQYRALRALGLSVDILPPDCDDLAAYALVLLPGLMTIGERLERAIEACPGAVLAGPRTGAKTIDFALRTSGSVLPGLNTRPAYVESLRPGAGRALQQGGSFEHWVETLDGDDPVLERTVCGKAARVGTAQRQYLAGWADQAALVRILESICVAQGIAVMRLPQGLRRRDTDQHRFLFNYGAEPVTFDGITLAPAGVHWQPLL
uniref:beta-galactosidase n=1 Tax=Marinobacterium profundum TaxID=1714300 RepID=UPI0008313003|nr:beta-galactosidase [Marinobacterium profundum]